MEKFEAAFKRPNILNYNRVILCRCLVTSPKWLCHKCKYRVKSTG